MIFIRYKKHEYSECMVSAFKQNKIPTFRISRIHYFYFATRLMILPGT